MSPVCQQPTFTRPPHSAAVDPNSSPGRRHSAVCELLSRHEEPPLFSGPANFSFSEKVGTRAPASATFPVELRRQGRSWLETAGIRHRPGHAPEHRRCEPSAATGGVPRILRISPKPWPPSSPSLLSSSPSGGLPGLRPWPQHRCRGRAAVVGSVSGPCRRVQE